MASDLKNQVAIVTGAGVGIGFEIANTFVSNGASVILNDINAELTEKACKKIGSDRCIGCAGDASKLPFIEHMVAMSVKHFSKLNVVIANAGITTYSTFLNYDENMFQRLIGLNLKGSFFLAQAAAKEMIKQKSGGRIIFMSSVTGVQALPFLVAYGMTKAALRMLAKGLVAELAPYGITTNAIAPGAVATERTISEDPNYGEIWAKFTPTGKITLPRDIARTALFLASPGAAQINGQTIVVDGGWTATSSVPDPEELDFPEE